MYAQQCVQPTRTNGRTLVLSYRDPRPATSSSSRERLDVYLFAKVRPLTRTTGSFLRKLHVLDHRPCSQEGLLVIRAAGLHPVPSRTRSLSLPAPMILPGQPGGNVGHRQGTFFDSRPTPRPLYSVPSSQGQTAPPGRGTFDSLGVRRSRRPAGLILGAAPVERPYRPRWRAEPSPLSSTLHELNNQKSGKRPYS